LRGRRRGQYNVTPLHRAAATHHDAGAPCGEFYFGEAAPVGNNSEAIDQLNQGGVVTRQWQIGR
jgi:predicted amidohydrolase